jgi:NAD(P)-dependent dehydrogenase (short-subunit alcohol dehydrogenase family)
MELLDTIAVVTRAAKGIGFLAAQTLTDAGASVYVADADAARGHAAVVALRNMRHSLLDLQDCRFVAMDAAAPATVDEAAAQVLAASPVLDIIVNIVPAAAPSPAEAGRLLWPFLPAMTGIGRGRIINVGIADDRDAPGAGDHPAAALTGGLAKDLARHWVTVNCITMGADGDTLAAEFAELLLFFAGPGAGHVTGQVLRLNGRLRDVA